MLLVDILLEESKVLAKDKLDPLRVVSEDNVTLPLNVWVPEVLILLV